MTVLDELAQVTTNQVTHLCSLVYSSVPGRRVLVHLIHGGGDSRTVDPKDHTPIAVLNELVGGPQQVIHNQPAVTVSIVSAVAMSEVLDECLG